MPSAMFVFPDWSLTSARRCVEIPHKSREKFSLLRPNFKTFSSSEASGVPRGGCSTPPPKKIPKVSVESPIAWARRTGVLISFCSSLCSHTVVIYEIKVSFNTNCLAVAYLVSEFKCTPASQNFDKIKPVCKLSGKCLVFHSNILISLKIAEFRTPTPQDVKKKGSKILKLPTFTIVLH